jgi:lipoate-protein ligase B
VPDQLLLLDTVVPQNGRPQQRARRSTQRQLPECSSSQLAAAAAYYHGPRQLVGYPIIDLKPDRCDLHRYLRDLEQVLILTLAAFGIHAERKQGLTGVWVADHKIAAIGVRVSSGWISSHGFALNVDPDLRFFDAIVPCGIREHGVTSMARVLGVAPTMAAVETTLIAEFASVFERAASVC